MVRAFEKLDLRIEGNRARVRESLAEFGISLSSDALTFASSKLSEDWVVAWAGSVFHVRTGKKATSVIHIQNWAELVQSIYDLRAIPGIEEQLRRLCTPSHEALDTCLALQIAGRYARQGFRVAFEPNGKGCSDLLIQNSEIRSYIEVKRENEQEHKRFMSIERCSNEVLWKLETQLRSWLEDRDLRIELKFPRSFHLSRVGPISDEIVRDLPLCEVGKERCVNAMRNARYVLLERPNTPHFEKKFQYHKGFIRVKQPGSPVPLSVQNIPILVIFDRHPNFDAFKRRVQRASKQLRNDTVKDPQARGFFVMQGSNGEAEKEAIVSRYFSSLPSNCFGIVLLSAPAFLIPSSGVSKEMTQVMAIAANAPFVGDGHLRT